MIRPAALRGPSFTALWIVVLAALLPATGSAQESVVEGLEVWGGAGAWASGPGSDLPVGARFGLAAFGASSPRRHFALEVVYGRFSPDGSRRIVTEFGVAVAARWALSDADRVHPFVQFRAGLDRRKGSAARSEPTQDALVLGPEVGVVIPVSERVGLLAGLDAAWHAFRDLRSDTGVIRDTGGQGWRWGLRVGLTVRTDLDAGGTTRAGTGARR